MEIQPESLSPYSIVTLVLNLSTLIAYMKKKERKGMGPVAERRNENEREREERQILLSVTQSPCLLIYQKFPGKNDLLEQPLELFLSCGKWEFSKPSSSCST